MTCFEYYILSFKNYKFLAAGLCGGPLTALLAAKLNSEIELLTNYERGIMKTRLFSGVLIVLLSGKNKAVVMSSLTYILH